MRDDERTNEQTLKIELLSQWKLEAEFRNMNNKDRLVGQLTRPRLDRTFNH